MVDFASIEFDPQLTEEGIWADVTVTNGDTVQKLRLRVGRAARPWRII